MKKVDVSHVSDFALLLELLDGLFLVHCWDVDSTLLAHKTISLHVIIFKWFLIFIYCKVTKKIPYMQYFKGLFYCN